MSDAAEQVNRDCRRYWTEYVEAEIDDLWEGVDVEAGEGPSDIYYAARLNWLRRLLNGEE